MHVVTYLILIVALFAGVTEYSGGKQALADTSPSADQETSQSNDLADEVGATRRIKAAAGGKPNAREGLPDVENNVNRVPRDRFMLEVFVDFPDDALSYPHAITSQHIDSMMATLAAAGVNRVIWAYYDDGHGGPFMFGNYLATLQDVSAETDQTQSEAYIRTLDVLGNPLRVATAAAHRHGLELYACYKPYETGLSAIFPAGSPQAREWGRLPHIGGYLTWLSPFVVENPHLRIQRRTDDLRPGIETATIRSIRLTKKDATPTRVTKGHLQIWTSDLNYRYKPKAIDFEFEEEVIASTEEVRDIDGKLLTKRGDPVRVLTLSGLRLDDPYILVTTDFTEGPGDFENAWHRILTAYDNEGREIPGVIGTGTAIWFPELDDPRTGGVNFDTGRGPQVVTLDVPNHFSGDRGQGFSAAHSNAHFRGCVAYARGRNAYLPGALCETEPQVQKFWLCCVGEMLAAGVDGIDIRVENHSTHTDTPEDYGFNPAVLQQLPSGTAIDLADIARVRGDAYTDFLRKTKAATASAGRRLRVTLNRGWFRPAETRAVRQRLAYPANLDFQWQKWVAEGLLDGAMIRNFGVPFAGVFGEDEVAQEMIAACRQRDIPVTVNRYVWANPSLVEEFDRIAQDGRFAGFVLYETATYTHFTEAAGCVMAGPQQPGWSNDSPATWQQRTQTSARVQEIFRRAREAKQSTR
ncbi:MAG: hypothetical protein ACR2PF_12400 [Rhizobiaceae bacterium]